MRPHPPNQQSEREQASLHRSSTRARRVRPDRRGPTPDARQCRRSRLTTSLTPGHARLPYQRAQIWRTGGNARHRRRQTRRQLHEGGPDRIDIVCSQPERSWSQVSSQATPWTVATRGTQATVGRVIGEPKPQSHAQRYQPAVTQKIAPTRCATLTLVVCLGCVEEGDVSLPGADIAEADRFLASAEFTVNRNIRSGRSNT